MITLAHDMLETTSLPMGTATIATTSLALSSVGVATPYWHMRLLMPITGELYPIPYTFIWQDGGNLGQLSGSWVCFRLQHQPIQHNFSSHQPRRNQRLLYTIKFHSNLTLISLA